MIYHVADRDRPRRSDIQIHHIAFDAVERHEVALLEFRSLLRVDGAGLLQQVDQVVVVRAIQLARLLKRRRRSRVFRDRGLDLRGTLGVEQRTPVGAFAEVQLVVADAFLLRAQHREPVGEQLLGELLIAHLSAFERIGHRKRVGAVVGLKVAQPAPVCAGLERGHPTCERGSHHLIDLPVQAHVDARLQRPGLVDLALAERRAQGTLDEFFRRRPVVEDARTERDPTGERAELVTQRRVAPDGPRYEVHDAAVDAGGGLGTADLVRKLRRP